MNNIEDTRATMNDEVQASGKATRETVIEVRRWTDRLLSFKTSRPADFRFKAGQYARLGLEVDGQMIWRAYSVVSAPGDDFLEYYGVIVPNGLFTGRLDLIRSGDAVWTEKQSYGFMTPDRFTDGGDLWMFATGTGIGPFISILRDPAVWNQFNRLLLVHCVRHAEELSYRAELESLKNSRPAGASETAELSLIASVTREATGNNPSPALADAPLNGRIPLLLENGELEKQTGLPITVESSRIMLCGNPAMIEDTRKVLHSRGMKPCRRAVSGQFVTENYW